jgi:hypothetical protein
MAQTPHTNLRVEDIRLADILFWQLPEPERDAAFATLRTERPVSWHEEFEYPGVPKGPGFWAVTRYHDLQTASRNPQLFLSGKGTSMADMPVELNEFFGSMINMDAPRHTKLRNIVNRGFTPRMVARTEQTVRARARRIINDVCERGECDFVTDIAAALPLEIISEMMGIPPSDYRRIFELTNTILGVGDPEYATTIEELMAAGLELAQYGQALAQARIDHPQDDLTSKLVHAEVEGETLTAQELGSFFILLVAAGNETTRNAISHGMKALTDFPDERRKWMNDFARVTPTAVEEICAGPRRSNTSGARPPKTPSSAANPSRQATRSCSGTTPPIATRTCSRIRTASMSPASPTSTSASAAAGRTTASAPTSRAARSRSCSRSSSAPCPTSRSAASRRCCCPPSSTASSACPAASLSLHDPTAHPAGRNCAIDGPVVVRSTSAHLGTPSPD